MVKLFSTNTPMMRRILLLLLCCLGDCSYVQSYLIIIKPIIWTYWTQEIPFMINIGSCCSDSPGNHTLLGNLCLSSQTLQMILKKVIGLDPT